MAERDQKASIRRLTEQMDKDNLDALILTSGDAVFMQQVMHQEIYIKTGRQEER